MKTRLTAESGLARTMLLLLALSPVALVAQVPVDENGEVIGTFEAQPHSKATGNEDIPLLSTVDLEELVGPIALYPDDLLAIVLPAAAYPLQLIDAARFLEQLEDDATLKPDPEWDDSVVALINYPEVIELLNEDIDWTWRLGEAVVSQQTDVVAAIETFRDRAYAAGNLKSDSYQNVSRDEGIIEITPVSEDVIYVPYYEPERVVVYQPRPAYYYYPRPYPVYYYPYSSAHAFDRGYFWGVTTAFSIGWYTDSLHVFHHSYHGHPYFGHRYWNRWWYRRPSLNIHNTTYVGHNTNVTINRYYGGDRWRPRHNRRDYVRQPRVIRNRHYPTPRRDQDVANARRASDPQRSYTRRQVTRNTTTRRSADRDPISFRQRPDKLTENRRNESRARRDETRVRSDERRVRRQEPQLRRQEPRVRRQEPQVRRQERQVRRQQPRVQRQEPQVRRQERQVRRQEPRVQRQESQVRRQESANAAPSRKHKPGRKSESKRGRRH